MFQGGPASVPAAKRYVRSHRRMEQLFRKRWFWVAWTTAFTAFVLSLSVSVGTQSVYDLQTPIVQPMWRVLLEWAHVIPEGHRKIHPSSLDPIVHQLPYIVISYIALSTILVAVLWGVSKVNGVKRPNKAL